MGLALSFMGLISLNMFSKLGLLVVGSMDRRSIDTPLIYFNFMGVFSDYLNVMLLHYGGENQVFLIFDVKFV